MSAPRAATPGLGGRARKTELELELGSSTQTSHRLLAYSDALLSIIATVMVSAGRGGLRGARTLSDGQRLGGEGRGLRPACPGVAALPLLPCLTDRAQRRARVPRCVYIPPSPAPTPFSPERSLPSVGAAPGSRERVPRTSTGVALLLMSRYVTQYESLYEP